jgi:predicted metal-dependent peptidase
MSSQILEQVSKTTIQLILKEPFYGHFFTGLLKEVTDKIPTMAVGSTANKMVKLYVNPNFWTEVLSTPEYRYGVLKHEILHIVFKHILTGKQYPNKRIFNIAADIVVNQFIEKKQLPEGAILLEHFAELNLEINKDVGYYYEKLLKIWRKDAGKSCPILEKLMNSSSWAIEMHDLWGKEFEKMNESERKIIESMIHDVLQNSVKRIGPKSIGNLPLGLQEYINELILSFEPTIDWKRQLRLFVGSSIRTYLKNTIRRPSKRYGTTPGIKIKSRQKILVAIDTSGSIDNDDLSEFFSELYHIWKQKAEIYVVECDTHIHAKYFYRGIMPELIHGRGGTDFNEPIRFANEAYLADAIIYFTDGVCVAPTVPNRKPIMWLISTEGIKQDSEMWNDLKGRKVKMQKDKLRKNEA